MDPISLHLCDSHRRNEIIKSHLGNHMTTALLASGFQTLPNDDQIIYKVKTDRNFLLAAKVIDNILFISTLITLQEELIAAMQSAGYTVKIEAKDKIIGMKEERNLNGDYLRHECNLMTKYDITAKAVTPLPDISVKANYIVTKQIIPTNRRGHHSPRPFNSATFHMPYQH